MNTLDKELFIVEETSKTTDKTVSTASQNAGVHYDLQPGEKVFTVLLFGICAFFLYQSYKLWQTNPGINGPAIIPLITSGLPALLLGASLISNIWKKTPLNGIPAVSEKLNAVREYLFSNNVLVALLAIFVYCVLLSFHVPFYIDTGLFLWGLMMYLSRGKAVRNLIATLLCLAFIAVVFGLLFKVVMP